MALDELNDLLALVSNDADKTALTQLLERNSMLQARVASNHLVAQGLLNGDAQAQALLAALATGQPANPAQPTNPAQPVNPAQPATAAAAAPTLDLAKLEELIDARFKPLATRLDSDLSEAKLEAVVNKVAEKLAPAWRASALEQADTIYTIRDSHQREFGEPLNRPDFEKFITDNPGKYGNLSAAHDAFVSEKRIQKKIDDGVQKELAARQTNAVPGTTIPSASPLTAIFAANPSNKVTDGTARGDGLNAAVTAFRALRAGQS